MFISTHLKAFRVTPKIILNYLRKFADSFHYNFPYNLSNMFLCMSVCN